MPPEMKYVTVGLKEEVIELAPEFTRQIRDAMEKCSKTGVLNFQLMGLREIPREALKLKCIKELRLDSNQHIGFSDKGVPTELAQLKILSMKTCDFIQLPDTLSVLAKLETLELQQNLLIALPYTISRLKRLKFINASNNRLYEIPNGLGQLEGLSEVILENNNILYAPPDIKDWKKLDVLSLARNRISVFPEGLCRLKFLRRLNIEGNRLLSISRSIKDLPLEILRIGYNFIEWLPDDMFSSTLGQTIERFSCPENNLLDLPMSIKDVREECCIEAEFNPFVSPPTYVLAEGTKVIDG